MTPLTEAAGPAAPVARQIPKEMKLHGDTRVDPYFWLREKENPEVIRYLEAENGYTAAVMKHTAPLQEKLYQEMLGRIKQDDASVPERIGDYEYYRRNETGKQYPIYCRRKPGAAEEILLDANQLAAGKKYFRLGVFEVSPDHKLLAFSTDTDGSEVYTLQVKDLSTGKLLSDSVPNTYYAVEWAEDNSTLFYNTLDHAKRPYRLWRHKLGADAKTDHLVYEEKDERFTLGISKTRSGRFLMLRLGSKISSEIRYLDSSKPDGAFQTLLPRRADVLYGADHHGDSFFVTIGDQGKNFRLVEAPFADPANEAKWKEILPHRRDAAIEDVELFAGHMVVVVRENAVRRVRVFEFAAAKWHDVEFPEPVYTVSIARNPEYRTSELRFSYASLITPESVFDYDMAARTRKLRKEQPVLGGYDRTQYTSERVFATAHDGVKVPISLVYRKGVKLDGSNPALLYGYGSYGAPSEPYFSSERLSLLDRGFVYAIAHIRGGGDLGRYWYEDGKMLKKKNTFRDFVSCAEFLIQQKYTNPKKLAILGGSAGGLLMGAVVNMRPELFAAVVAKVAFVDVVNSILDTSLPLTVTEFEEWGNPKEQTYYEYMKSYAPYENVEKKSYPNMLLTAGLNDPRVPYWEPAKWTARMRTMRTDSNWLLLKTNMGAGHGGPSGRYERLRETAFDYAFILDRLGM